MDINSIALAAITLVLSINTSVPAEIKIADNLSDKKIYKRNTNRIKNIAVLKLIILLLGCSFVPHSSHAAMFNFSCITSNGYGTCDTAEAQMKLEITAYGNNQVLFDFSNNDIGSGTDYGAIIGEVYIYDGVFLDTTFVPTIINGKGVSFDYSDTHPAKLPGYDSGLLDVFASADVTKKTKDGVDADDGTLGLIFTLLPGTNYNTIIDAMYSGDMVVGIHAKALGGDDVSESLVSAVPVPAAVWLFGSGLLCLIGVARRKVSA